MKSINTLLYSRTSWIRTFFVRTNDVAPQSWSKNLPGVRDPLEVGESSTSSSFRFGGFSGVRTSAIGFGERFSDCELTDDSFLEESFVAPGSGLDVTGLKNLVILAWPDILGNKGEYILTRCLRFQRHLFIALKIPVFLMSRKIILT